MLRYLFYGITIASLDWGTSFALNVENADIKQNHIGNVEAKLEAHNIINSTVQNSAAGNSFNARGNANIQGVQITQENFGNVSSNLSVHNLANEAVQQNVAGTVVVIN